MSAAAAANAGAARAEALKADVMPKARHISREKSSSNRRTTVRMSGLMERAWIAICRFIMSLLVATTRVDARSMPARRSTSFLSASPDTIGTRQSLTIETSEAVGSS